MPRANRPPSAAGSPRLLAIGLPLWLTAVLVPAVQLWRYKSLPGAQADAPLRWPAASRIERDPTRTTILLFAHPMCPCTAASLSELGRLAADSERVLACVLFDVPSDADDSWCHSANWARAAAIPGVRVRQDCDGAEATRFAALTSGQVVAYAPDGTLLFSGGLTTARGHAGPSPFTAGLTNALTDQGGAAVSAPVFGCPLREPR